MVHIIWITFFVFLPYSSVDKIVSDRCYLFIYFSIQFMTEKHRTTRCFSTAGNRIFFTIFGHKEVTYSLLHQKIQNESESRAGAFRIFATQY